MYFRQIRDAIITTLGNAASGNYRVLGYQQKGFSAEEVLDDDRTVRVFYSRGNMSQSSSYLSGPFNHEMTFKIELEASKRTEVDLTVIQNPSATGAQVQAAWAALKTSEQAADESLDELWDYVFQAIMDARQRDFGLSFPIGSRWLTDFNKETVMPRGEYAIISGTAEITCNVDEEVSGETPTALDIIDTVIDIPDDDVEKTGVLVDNS
jgi:hypothetical protein